MRTRVRKSVEVASDFKYVLENQWKVPLSLNLENLALENQWKVPLSLNLENPVQENQWSAFSPQGSLKQIFWIKTL